MITYKKMSLLDAPPGSVIAHAVNCEGLWNSGVAAQLKEKYPLSFELYEDSDERRFDPGMVFIDYVGSDYIIYNLFTSEKDSRNPDDVDLILINTTLALNATFQGFYRGLQEIYMPKINSGAFNVPWEKTERIVKILSDRYNVDVVVCDPNLDEKL